MSSKFILGACLEASQDHESPVNIHKACPTCIGRSGRSSRFLPLGAEEQSETFHAASTIQASDLLRQGRRAWQSGVHR